MANNNRHNTAFVVGSVLGAVAGAAVALWKTPYSGEELRTKLGASGSHETTGAQTYTATPAASTTTGERTLKDKVLSTVEKTLAPVVGVELGKTANGSGATVMDSGEIRVNTGTPGVAATASTEAQTGPGRLGLSRDKVDAGKWAEAYGTSAETTASAPAASATPLEDEAGTTMLRHPHAWQDGSEAATTTSVGKTETVGASDTTDPSATAASTYGDAEGEPEPTGYGTTMLRHPHAWTDGSEDETASGARRITGSRSKVDPGKWAEAYGTTLPEGGSGYASKEAESASQTGLGSKPAYPGNDQTGHQSVDREAPDSNVGDVSRGAGARAEEEESDLTVQDAASVDDLTTPQVHRVPDSQKETGAAAYHPFPKLGGKER